MIYAHCFGGPTTFYQGMGEIDVLKVIAEAKRRFAVDPERVFIMGHSMGGAGSYTVGLHYPDQFGGIFAGDPAMGPTVAPMPEKPPAWMLPQIAIVSPPKLFPNARNVDVFFKNAGAGIQRNSTEYSDGIVAAGGFATTEVLPGMPHDFGRMYHQAAWVTEVIQHPIRRHPVEVKYYTNTLQYNQAYWVTIDRLTKHNADASVTAACENGRSRYHQQHRRAYAAPGRCPRGGRIAAPADDRRPGCAGWAVAFGGSCLKAGRPMARGAMEGRRPGKASRPARPDWRRVQLALPGRLRRRGPGPGDQGIGRHPQSHRAVRRSRRFSHEGRRGGNGGGC